MSESPESEDSFADLYGKLPDGASRRDVAPAPGSRRAAREAAAREAAASANNAPQPSDPTAASDAPEQAPAPRSTAEHAAPVSASTSHSREHDTTVDDIFAVDPGAQEQRRHKRGRRLGCTVVLALILLLVGGIAAGGFWVWNTYEDQIREVMGWQEPKDYEEGLAEGEAVITIEEGDNPSDISVTLYDAGVTKTSDAFYSYLVDEGLSPTFYPGAYQLQQKMTSAAALAALEDDANRLENTVVIPEGLGYLDALQRVADSTGISYDELVAEADDYTQFGVPADAPSLEGFLFPATYTFDPDATATSAIQRMVDEMFSRLDAMGVAEEDRLDVLTLASIIQKEAGPDVADMAKISRVFLNRLDQGMALQSDATVAYGAGLSGTVWTTEEQRADESNIYNTYAHTGLPAGPISLPGEDAIDAAINPADGDWLYFVAVNLQTGETVFSNTYDEHLAAVEQMRAWCAASDENAGYCQ